MKGTEIMRIGGRLYNIDKCIAPLVKALNMSGFETVASCCGHGKKLGNIVLQDGRELIIAPNYETARMIHKGAVHHG